MRFTEHELKLLMEALAEYNKVIFSDINKVTYNGEKGSLNLLNAKQEQITNLHRKIEINVFGVDAE